MTLRILYNLNYTLFYYILFTLFIIERLFYSIYYYIFANYSCNNVQCVVSVTFCNLLFYSYTSLIE